VTGLAIALVAVFDLLCLMHLYWAVGGRVGNLQALPERTDGTVLFRPGPASTLVVAALLATAGLLVAQRAGILPGPFPPALVRLGCWCVSGALVLRAVGEFRYVGFFKKVRGTAFARMDTLFYSPLALVLGAGAGYVAFMAP
jgi:hypothetical protein